MSGPLINRSLTTVRTELEFLRDSEVITDALYDKIVGVLPHKYQKDAPPVDVDVLGGSTGASEKPKPQDLSANFAAMKVTSDAPAGPPPDYQSAPRGPTKPLGYCKASYDYQSDQNGDLALKEGDKIAIVEHMSEDWWKGYKKGDHPDKPGLFPSNYVETISELEFNQDFSRPAGPPPPKKENYGDRGYDQPNYGAPMQPQYSNQSYGGYAQYPPPSTNYYPPQQYQQAPQQVPQPAPEQGQPPKEHGHLRKFGGKLGNAAIFGAGATIGSDIVNSIF